MRQAGQGSLLSLSAGAQTDPEVKELVQGHSGTKSHSQDSNPSC